METVCETSKGPKFGSISINLTSKAAEVVFVADLVVPATVFAVAAAFGAAEAAGAAFLTAAGAVLTAVTANGEEDDEDEDEEEDGGGFLKVDGFFVTAAGVGAEKMSEKRSSVAEGLAVFLTVEEEGEEEDVVETAGFFCAAVLVVDGTTLAGVFVLIVSVVWEGSACVQRGSGSMAGRRLLLLSLAVKCL